MMVKLAHTLVALGTVRSKRWTVDLTCATVPRLVDVRNLSLPHALFLIMYFGFIDLKWLL